jgi:hypothetical protein
VPAEYSSPVTKALVFRWLSKLQKSIAHGPFRIAPTFSNRFAQDIRLIYPRVHINKICAHTSRV